MRPISRTTPPSPTPEPAGSTPGEPYARAQRQMLRDRRTSDLLEEAARADGEGRRRLLDEVVELNLPVAREVALRYRDRGIALEDLVQVASMALVQAVRRFEPARGSALLAYAVPTMRGEVRKCFRDLGWVVRPPRRLQELQARIWSSETTLTQQLQRAPTLGEVAAHLGSTAEEVREALAVDGCFAPSSLDAPSGESDDGAPNSWAERLGTEDAEFSRAEARVVLAPLIASLEGRDRQIVELRYFAQMTQAQIGQVIGVTQMQVSRLLTRIMRQLRAEVDPTAA